MTAANVTAQTNSTGWDAQYERRVIPVLAIGFGVVMLDRAIINPLFPLMRRELGLSYQDLGQISAVLALTWGLASIFTGRLSDRIGRKHVLVPATIVFSLLVATTGLATGLASLLLIRGIMGFAEGAYVPASIVATIEASKPNRVGFNIGIQQMAAPLVGAGLGPLIAVGLLKILPNWHWVFAVAALPGFLVVTVLMLVLRHDRPAPAAVRTPPISYWEVLKYRNLVFSVLGMCCCLTMLFTFLTFMPNFLTDHAHLSTTAMGTVLAASGFGQASGMVIVPSISDRAGRKIVILFALLAGLGFITGLLAAGSNTTALFVLLFGATFCIGGVVAITVGPLVGHSVPAAIVTTATGLVVGAGEMVGGALVPAVAGAAADAEGIAVIIPIAIAAIVAALFVYGFGVQEPQKIAPVSLTGLV